MINDEWDEKTIKSGERFKRILKEVIKEENDGTGKTEIILKLYPDGAEGLIEVAVKLDDFFAPHQFDKSPPKRIVRSKLLSDLQMITERLLSDGKVLFPKLSFSEQCSALDADVSASDGRCAQLYETRNRFEAGSDQRGLAYASSIALVYCQEAKYAMSAGDLSHAWQCIERSKNWICSREDIKKLLQKRKNVSSSGGESKSSKLYGWIKNELVERLANGSWESMKHAAASLHPGMLEYIKTCEPGHPLVSGDDADFERTLYEWIRVDQKARSAFNKNMVSARRKRRS